MSIKNWLIKKPLPVTEGLPDPNKCSSIEQAKNCVSANAEISLISSPKPHGNKRKRGDYIAYTPEQRLEIGQYGALHGASRAAKHFSKKLDRPVNESSVRGMIKSYQKELKTENNNNLTALPPSKRGRPVLLGDKLDNAVIHHVKAIRTEGGVVNSAIVIATARGILKDTNRGLLHENGGPISLSKTWAKSILKRMGWVKRKGTKAARKLPDDYEHVRSNFLDTVEKTVKEKSIPKSMIVNFDETGVNIVPASNWTLHEQGAKQVPITGIDDKRQITAVLGNTPTGNMLPPQLIYGGKTDKCHPSFQFPEDWNITHSSNHWTNEDTTKEYILNVLVPYLEAERKALALPDDHPALLILDIFAAHRTLAVKELCAEHHIVMVFVPANCTGELQPLDVSCNGEFKAFMKQMFSDWYSDQVLKQLRYGDGQFALDLKLSTLKPLHANWLLQSWDMLRNKPETTIRGWRQAGILAVLD